MLPIFMWSLVLAASIYVLVKSSDFFTDSAELLGVKLGLPAFIVGVTITSIGTSLPELVSSVIAVIQGSSEIVMGNVVGSNIANIFLVLGVASIIAKKLDITFELINVDLPLLVGSAFFLTLTIFDGVFSLVDGLFCIAGFIIYLWYTITSEKENKDREITKEVKKDVTGRVFNNRYLFILLASCLFIYIGAKYTVESVIMLSGILGIGTEVIAITAVALGTSLPELVVTLSASNKGNPEMAVGNVLGSCIFNVFAVTGISSLFGALAVPQSILMFSLPVMLFATLLFFFMAQDKEMTRWEGWILILFYVFFIGKLFNFV